VARPSHPPIPSDEFDSSELLAIEKESLGLFISAHPLKPVRAALAERADCPLSELAARRDGDWVRVGGIVTQTKRIRTKKGDPMMFATLDDLEGQVEMLVFNSAYASNADKVETDRVVLVRGRVDHKEAGETKLVAQDVEAFEPTPEEVQAAAAKASAPPPQPGHVTLRVEVDVPDTFLEDLREVVRSFPGDHQLRLEIGERRLVLGPDWRVSSSSACRAYLDALLASGAPAAERLAAADGSA
jgi:DNA polymerase-3 subunit alpha